MKKIELYNQIKSEGIYLPDLKSKTITLKYLQLVAGRSVIYLNENDKDHALAIDIPKQELFEEFKTFSDNWGFDVDTLPDKEWLLEACYKVNPDHEIFRLNNELISSGNDYHADPSADNIEKYMNIHRQFNQQECLIKQRHKTKRRAHKISKLHSMLLKIKNKYNFLEISDDIAVLFVNNFQ